MKADAEKEPAEIFCSLKNESVIKAIFSMFGIYFLKYENLWPIMRRFSRNTLSSKEKRKISGNRMI